MSPRVCLGLALLVLPACNNEPHRDHQDAPAGQPSAVAAPTATGLGPFEPTGVEDCDAYFQAAVACFPKAEPDLRRDLRESVARYENQVTRAKSDVAKQAVGVGCAAALEALQEDGACP